MDVTFICDLESVKEFYADVPFIMSFFYWLPCVKVNKVGIIPNVFLCESLSYVFIPLHYIREGRMD